MIPFNPSKVAFGRHETFPLRFGWLTKGFRSWCEDPDAFNQEDPTVILGVGKNMVTAIRYWLEATQTVESVQGHSVNPTDIGRRIFSAKAGWDPFLEDDTTLWLIHWLVSSNPVDATTFFWFFNGYHKPEFTSTELLGALKDFAQEKVKGRTAENTLRHDINVLLRMYGPPEQAKGAPIEEGLDSPMTTLGLIQRSNDGKHYMSRVSERRRLPIASFGFAVLDLMEALNQMIIPVERLQRADSQYAAPGSVFRLTENGLITKIEELVRWMPGTFALRESAGIHQLHQLQLYSKFDVLTEHYSPTRMDRAA